MWISLGAGLWLWGNSGLKASRRSFLDLVTEPAYGPIEPYKLMALEVVLVPLSGEVIFPDIRLVTVATALVIFLAAGWIRAARGRP